MKKKKIIIIASVAAAIIGIIATIFILKNMGKDKVVMSNTEISPKETSNVESEKTEYEWIEYLNSKIKAITKEENDSGIERKEFDKEKYIEWTSELPTVNKNTGKYTRTGRIPLTFDGKGFSYTDINIGKEDSKLLWNVNVEGTEKRVTEFGFRFEVPDKIDQINIEKYFKDSKYEYSVLKGSNNDNYFRSLYEVKTPDNTFWIDFSWSVSLISGKYSTYAYIDVYLNKADTDKVFFPKDYTPPPLFGKTKSITSGLLLGIKSNNNCFTYWIYPEDGVMKVKRGTGFIVTPYEDKFWVINRNHLYRDDSKKAPGTAYSFWGLDLWYLTSNPIDIARNKINPDTYSLANGFIGETREENLMFVGNKYFVQEKNLRLIEKNYKLTGYNYSNIFKIDNMSNEADNIKLSEIFNISYDQMNKYNITPNFDKVTNPGIKDVVNKLYSNSAFGNDVIVTRENGKFVAKLKIKKAGQGDYLVPENTGTFDNLTPKNDFFGYDELQYGWNNLQKQILDLDDAVQSPDGKMIVAIHSGKVSVYEVDNGTLINISNHYQGDGSIIMAQWTNANYLNSWKDNLSKAGLIDYPNSNIAP